MPREPNDAAAIYDMLRAAEGALRHTSGKTREDYEREEILRDAVERKIEIAGEAARRLSDEFCARNSHVPWRIIRATRHILAHDYDEVDNDVVWRIVTNHLPPLVAQLTELLPPTPVDPEEIS